jgi:hypothetical protein
MKVGVPIAGTLLNFFVNRMLIAVGTEFFQFHACCGIATVFLRSVPGHTR